MLQNKIFSYLEKAQNGYLEIITPEHNKIEIGNPDSALRANIVINDWQLISMAAKSGDIGFGEAYMDGFFCTDDLVKLLSFFVINQEYLEDIFHGNFLVSFFGFISNLFKRNTINGSIKNISYHYDISNDFYKIWLDKSLTYSSGIFYGHEDLATAQQNKYQRILNHLTPGENILEIGCGWGGFIEAAAKQGKIVKGLTLSKKQSEIAKARIEAGKLKGEIAIQDYRHETSQFDNVVSIEMFEAVGREYWQDYFRKIKEVLNPGGKAVIQTITIEDKVFGKYVKTDDFIRRYIFPGGILPSKSIFQEMANFSQLKIIDQFEFGESYFRTLKFWLENFNANLVEVKKLGFDDKFIRKWQFYLAYCAAGFYGKRTDVVQYTLLSPS